jgi:GDPmannose 4,6-dehydratase
MRAIGIRIRWDGQGPEEKGYDEATGKCVVEIDPRYFRPTEVSTLLGDASKAKEKLGWVPTTTFKELVTEMMSEDLKEAKKDQLIKMHGFRYFTRRE